MSARDVMLTDEQWKKIEPLIPKARPVLSLIIEKSIKSKNRRKLIYISLKGTVRLTIFEGA